MWQIIKLGIAVILFAAPVIYIIRREWMLKRSGEGKPDSPTLTLSSFIRVALALAPMAALMVLMSFSAYSFYSPRDSALKVAFKHTGKRVADCDEGELFKKEGERYRQQLKETKQVRMNIAMLAKCPRERFPVVVEVLLDGKALLGKSYSPTGLRKDMASYVYEEFIISPGDHTIVVKLHDRGKKEAPDFIYEGAFNVKPKEIRLIRFDDKENRIVLE